LTLIPTALIITSLILRQHIGSTVLFVCMPETVAVVAGHIEIKDMPIVATRLCRFRPYAVMSFANYKSTPSPKPYIISSPLSTSYKCPSTTTKLPNMTTAYFKHIDTNSYKGKPWSKVDGPGTSFTQSDHLRNVTSLRGQEADFTTDNSGFAVYKYPAKETSFTDDAAVREGYYQEVENLLRDKLPGIKKVVIFDHTIRRRIKNSPRQPVQQVHVDQTPGAAEVRVRRHLPKEEADELVKGRYQIINVWRPIENPASDFPLAVIDWRSTSPSDFVPVDLLYPRRDSLDADDDDRGKEKLPDPASMDSTDGYEVKGETLSVAPNENHKFYYVKDMKPDEVMLLKCFDSRGEGMPQGIQKLALRTPHTAFVDPQTPKDAPGRQSIEVRCLVFYE
jgi:hypothetical protein